MWDIIRIYELLTVIRESILYCFFFTVILMVIIYVVFGLRKIKRLFLLW